jgi:putative membrane protein
VNISWWCSQISEPWGWKWRAYPGVWALVVLITVPYLVAVHRRTRVNGPEPGQRRRTLRFLGGVLAIWVASDWPLGLLGASYLASAHMLQYLLYTIVAAPLLLLGTPEWMARRILSRLRLYRFVVRLSRPIVAGLTFNALLLATHAPWTTDTLRSSQVGSMFMDLLWMVSGLIVWLPILAPLPELTRLGYGAKMAYLFLACGVVPVLPASFLTFADFPLYRTFELAPRVFDGLSAGEDQAMAGLVMKLGPIPIIWGTMLGMMVRWARAEGVPGLGPGPDRPVRSAGAG